MTSPMGEYLIESALVLLAVVGLGVLVLYAARRAGPERAAAPVELLARLPLEARRSIYVVRILDRVLIVGSSEGGLSQLGELPESAVERIRRAPSALGGAAPLMARWMRRDPLAAVPEGHGGSAPPRGRS